MNREKTSRPKVSIVIVLHNSLDYLKKFLPSILEQTYDHLEIIVVDNNSTDGSGDYVRESYRQIKLIQLQENMYFSRGNNIGISQSDGKYVLILNPDVMLDERFVENLVQFCERNGEVACCGGILYRYDFDQNIKTGVIDSAGIRMSKLNLLHPFSEIVSYQRRSIG